MNDEYDVIFEILFPWAPNILSYYCDDNLSKKKNRGDDMAVV